MRGGGVLMHVSSLPSKYGIGTLGSKAYEFVDFLYESGQKYWQILPIGPTAYGDSPYQSPSSYAGNPYFIDPDFLVSDGILRQEDIKDIFFGDDPQRVDYGAVYNGRNEMFRRIGDNFDTKGNPQFSEFCETNSHWLDDYALFMAVKENSNGAVWANVDSGVKYRSEDSLEKYRDKLRGKVVKHKILQFLFYRQWFALKSYANLKGIKIIGDMPIYVAYDSADVWCNREVFQLDGDLRPTAVAGCPPDSFSPQGQRWGNPLYDWDGEGKRKRVFEWWARRIEHSLKIFDMLRIDHFRAFADYYAIPSEDDTAERGRWCDGPGLEFFMYLKERLGELPIIAEDLGALSEKVSPLLAGSGFPGMKVLQFAFNSDASNPYLPHNYDRNFVAYIGTHDNTTAKGWLVNASDEERKYAKWYMELDGDGDVWSMIRTLYGSVADIAIVTVQDLLCLGADGRMNVPSTDRDNWRFRVPADYINKISAPRLRAITEMYGR